jgi:hypothetical protein
MFGSTTLDVVIGLIFIYLLVSLIVTAATELIAGWLSWRADKLWDGIRNLINSPEAGDWAQKLYDHPLIRGLSPLPTKGVSVANIILAPAAKGPSYIPAHSFSTALLDMVQNVEPTIAVVKKGLQDLLEKVSTSNLSTSAVKSEVLSLKNTIAASTPLAERIKTDLETLANKVSNSDLSLGLFKEAVQEVVDKVPGLDWTQVNLKNDLQTLITDPAQSGGSGASLQNLLQGLIKKIPDSEATVQSFKKDLYEILGRFPESGNSANSALEIIRAFANNVWERYISDIITQIPNANLCTTLTTLLQQSEGNFGKFKQAIETWFNDAMDRVSGWYKRHTQWVQVLLGIAFTFALNLDSVLIVKILSKDNSGLRESLVAAAQKFAQRPTVTNNPDLSAQPSPSPTSAGGQQPPNSAVASVSPEESYRLLQAQFDALNLPLGWTHGPPAGNVVGPDNADFRQWPGWTLQGWGDTIGYHFIGWVLTAIAVSLGAPFWFDLLGRFVAIRASGNLPAEQPKPPQGNAAPQKA